MLEVSDSDDEDDEALVQNQIGSQKISEGGRKAVEEARRMMKRLNNGEGSKSKRSVREPEDGDGEESKKEEAQDEQQLMGELLGSSDEEDDEESEEEPDESEEEMEQDLAEWTTGNKEENEGADEEGAND